MNRQHGQFKFDELSHLVIGCAIEVHSELGPGLFESSYETCLAYELETKGLQFRTQEELPVTYKHLKLNSGYRVDLIVENILIVEIKSVEKILGVHEAQILTYLKLAQIKTGLLINFNVAQLKKGIKRFVL